MDALIWTGAVVTLLGLAGLVRCILLALRLRRRPPPEAELRAALQRLVPLNLGAFLLSALGLMLVVTGVLLG